MNIVPNNIVESLDVISEEELLVQELDKRLSFDMVSVDWCECVIKKLEGPKPPTSSCGVRG